MMSGGDAVVRRLTPILVGLVAFACGGPSTLPTAPTNPATPPQGLDGAAVIDALDYWQSAAGITYVLIENSMEPRVLVRPGTDGLAPQGGGRGLIDGTYDDNRARSGLVVFEPGGGRYCRTSPASCRYLYRHEIGHALGFLGHSNAGLMWTGPDTLTGRERRMMAALYSLPHGAIVESDGRWSVASTGLSGMVDDLQAAQDIIAWNVDALGGASYRQRGIITRWELPIQVYLQQ
jgi:hypothetical protein